VLLTLQKEHLVKDGTSTLVHPIPSTPMCKLTRFTQ
jgi:hypothetical protein